MLQLLLQLIDLLLQPQHILYFLALVHMAFILLDHLIVIKFIGEINVLVLQLKYFLLLLHFVCLELLYQCIKLILRYAWYLLFHLFLLSLKFFNGLLLFLQLYFKIFMGSLHLTISFIHLLYCGLSVL